MVAFICLFFPAVLALCLFEKVNHSDFDLKKTVYLYCVFNLFINGSCFFVKEYILNTGMYTLTNGMDDMTASTAFRYLVMAVPLAIIFALIFTVLGKNVDINKEPQKK